MTLISPINRLIYIGTPDFAVPTLYKLSETKYKPILVITQPDRPQGRKLKLSVSPVKEAAERTGIEVIEPEHIKEVNVYNQLSEIKPDIIITVAYGGFLTRKILKLPKHGCINLHPSLLPKYRGATPINHTLFDGENETGITIAKMTLKMDSGPILHQKSIPIDQEDNYSSLAEKLAFLGSSEMIIVLEKLERGEITLVAQNDEEATYCYKLTKEDLIINWDEQAEKIHNKVRGLAEEPGAITTFRGKRIKILETKLLTEDANQPSGKVSEILKNEGIAVCCQDKKILLTRVQPAGKRIMTAFEYSIGARIEKGERFISGIGNRL